MLKKIICLSFACAALLSACSDEEKYLEVTPEPTGTVTDSDGNVYDYVRIGDQEWTTSNALNGTPITEFTWITDGFEDSWNTANYERAANYMAKYGNIMTYQDALESAPEGWRLPSDEDWQKLESYLGMKNAGERGWRGEGIAAGLKANDAGKGLSLTLCGGMIPMKVWGWYEYNIDSMEEYGYYWTSTIDRTAEDQDLVFYRKICCFNNSIGRESTGSVTSALAVRWVRDVK